MQGLGYGAAPEALAKALGGLVPCVVAVEAADGIAHCLACPGASGGDGRLLPAKVLLLAVDDVDALAHSALDGLLHHDAAYLAYGLHVQAISDPVRAAGDKNTRYKKRSCSRIILKGCRPIDILKTA